MKSLFICSRTAFAGVLASVTLCAISSAGAQDGFLATTSHARQESEKPSKVSKPAFPGLGDPIDKLKPSESGSGIVICEPVSAAGVNRETANFGAGCARWLQFVVGGQGQLGKTPLWESLNRARKELGRPDLRLKPADTAKLATMLGVTHATTGTVRGTTSQCTLTFQLLQIAGQKSSGPPIIITGSNAQILQKLPGMAITLSKLLGVTAPRIPTTVGATPNEIAVIGQLPLGPNFDLTDSQTAQLNAIARRTPLAAMFLLNTVAIGDEYTAKNLVKTCMGQVSDNALTYGLIAEQHPEQLIPYESRLVDLGKQYPLNAPIAIACSRLYMYRKMYDQQRIYSVNAVRGSYHSPDAWLALSILYNRESESVRQSRRYNDLSNTEHTYVRSAYENWMQSLNRAVELDDRNARVWTNVAIAAIFAFDYNMADSALWNAMRLDPNDYRVYQWGLEMYQPKWYGHPDKLQEVAQKALQAHFEQPDDALYIIDGLNACGFNDMAKQLVARTISIQEEIIRNRPNYVNAHRTLALACFRTNRYPDALKEYRKVAELSPNDVRSLLDLGVACKFNSQIDEALTAFQKAISLDPSRAESRHGAAEILLLLNRNTEAIREYQAYLHLAPRDETAYEQLAQLLLGAKRVPEAIQAAQKAVQIFGSSSRAHELLGEAYLRDHQFDASIAHLREAIRLNPQNETAKNTLDEALTK